MANFIKKMVGGNTKQGACCDVEIKEVTPSNYEKESAECCTDSNESGSSCCSANTTSNTSSCCG